MYVWLNISMHIGVYAYVCMFRFNQQTVLPPCIRAEQFNICMHTGMYMYACIYMCMYVPFLPPRQTDGGGEQVGSVTSTGEG